MQKSQLKVKYTHEGLANFYGDYIEINHKLKKDKELRDYILRHELGHTKEFDLAHEVEDSFQLIKRPRILFKIIWFYIRTPSSLKDLSPFRYVNKTFFIDINLICLYLFMGLLSFFLFKIIS